MPLYDVDVEGVTYEVTAPDENTAWQWANYTHRQKRAGAVSQQKAQPESGFMPALRSGVEGLLGAGTALAGRAGLMDMAEAEKAVEARRQRAAEIFKPTEDWGITKLTELLGGSIPYMAAPLAAAGAAAALPLTGTAAAVAGLGAAGLTSATQFTGTNLSRQIEEGKKLAETDLGAAALAAIPQAALDTLSLRMLPGVGKLLGDAGIKVTKETAKEVSEQILKKAAIDYAAATGRAMTAEGLTEAAQQGFERLQAGLSLTDADARKEYFDSLVGGALLGGTIAPAGRMLERGKAKREVAAIEQEEADTAAKAARAAEEERKQQPEYALQLDADYQAAVARMKELQAAIPKKPAKGALPEEQMAYAAAVEERNKHLKEVLQPLAAEYVPRKAEIAQLKERQRIEGLTPLEYQMEQAGVDITAPPEEERVFTGEEDLTAPVTPEVPPEAAYAQQQMDLARRQDLGMFDVSDYAQYLMQDPVMARALVDNKTPIPGVSKQESAAILGGIKLQLREQEQQKQARIRAELEQQQEDLAAQQRAVKTDTLDLWKASIEETEEQATEELLRPNFETIRPSGPAVVKTPENILPLQNAGTLLRRIDDLFATRDQADKATDIAFGSGNKEAGTKKAQEREAAQASLNAIEQTEGPGRALVALRKAQDTALMNTAQLTDDLRVGRTLGGPEAGTASSTPQTLINQINRERDAFVTAAVQEAATARKLFGKALTQEEATKAADEMRSVFNEWVTRTIAEPRGAVLEERVLQPAQMRGAEVVRGAETELVDPRPLEERRFGAYREATQVLQEQLRQIAAGLTSVPRDVRRVEAGPLKMQFPETEAAKVAEARGETAKTLEGALRRRRDYVSNLIDQAFQTRRVPGIADVLLTRSRDFLDRGTTGLLDAAENIADRLIRGQNIERSDLVQLRNELRAASARPGEAEVVGEREGQAELFPPETRRALAPAVEGTDLRGQPVAARAGSIGVIRETRRNFENAPPVRQGRAMLKRGQELLENIRAAWDKADKRKARIQEGKVAKAERAVEQQREEYRAAFTDALNEARLEQVVAKFQPQIDAAINQLAAFGKERAKALAAKDKDAARDIQTIMDMEREALQELRQQLAAAVRAPGAVLEPAEMKGTKQTRGFTQPEEVKAAADEWVQFERDALAKAEAKLAKLKGPEKAPAVREVAQQRKAVAQAQNTASRAMTGLGLPGLRRVAGEVTPIKAEKEAVEERQAAAAEQRAADAEAVKARVAEKTARETELEQLILDLGERRTEREEALTRVRTDASRERIQQELAEINKQATLAQAQLEAMGEKKPRRKGPATVVSGAGLARQRPLRTGYRKALEAAEEGMRAEREGAVEIPGTFEFGPQEKLFSRGSTANPSTIDSVRVELSKAFPDLNRVQIYDSVDALVAANPQYKGKIPSDARGFVDTAGNKAFLIAENINQGQAMSVLLHEVGAHVGLRNLLGAGQYDTLVNAVKSWEKRNDGSKESQVAQAARARVEAAETPPGQVNDELLAYAIEEAVNAGVKPTETKGVLGQWLGRVAALLRKALEKFGLPPKALDAQGIVDVAFGAAKMEMGFSVPKGKLSRIDTYEDAKNHDARLLRQVEQFLLTGTPVSAPTTLYRGGTAVGQAYTHATPWAGIAAKAGKLIGYDPRKPQPIYEYAAAKDQKYYRGGALEGDPLETTRIHNAKGMTWDQALAAAKKLFDAEVRALPDRYTDAYLADPENKQDAIEAVAGQVTEDFFNAVYETDAANRPGVWANRKVPDELMQDTPKLREAAPDGGGAPKTRMYHGSPNAQLKELRGLTFVTPNKQVAEQYANGEVAFTGRTEGSGGRVYEVEVDTTNALDFNKPEHRAEYERARKQWNETRDADERLPALTSPGFISSKTGYPSYGRVADILAAMPAFDSMFVDEGSQGFSLAVRDGRKLAAPAEIGSPSEILFSRNLPTASRVADDLSEQNDEFLPTPKRPNGPAVKTRILPDGKRQQVPRVAATPSKLPRIDDGAPDNDFYKVTGFVPDTSAPFHKMTLADAARFGASKARGQRKELFTRLAELFDEAPTPEKQGLVLATNGRRSSSGAYGAFYRQSNVVFTPGPNSAKYLDTLLHELTHAASSYALSVDKRLAARVEALRSKAAAWAETKEGKAYIRKNAMSLVSKDMQGNRGIYGLKNIDEFLAELYADRAFQKMLTQIPSDAPKKSLLTRFVEFMSSFFSDPDQAQQSLFAEAVALSEEVLETTRREIYGTDVELGEIRRPRAIASAAGNSDVAFSAKLPTASRVANDLIGTQPTWLDNLKSNFLGLGARTQFIDKYAPTEEALKRGKVEDLKANQARYYLRMYDQRMHFTSQAISDGAPVIVEKTRRDGRTERVVETAPGASISKVVDLLKRKDVIKEAGSADDANKLFTLYLAAIRGERVGFDRLNFGRAWAEAEIGRVEDELRSATLSPETRGNLQKKKASLEKRLDSMPTEADIKAAKAEIDANPVLSEAFREARDVYNAYNRDLMKFAMDTGAIGKELGNKLLSTNDYIPYYRMRDGVAQLMIGGETPIRIGNIKDSPHLQELVGGDEAIFDFLTSSVQNTSMLIDMSMKNLATKNLMFELRDVGLAKISKVKGGNAPTGSVTFKKDGEEYFAVVDTDALGIDSELLVKGLAGIPTMFPQMVRVLGMPARLLRRLVVASPVYMARQLVRDSSAAAIASGANMTPVISALRQIGKPSVLERRGITGGQVFTGMPEDQTRLLKEMQAGKIGLTSGLARLEALSAKADALTREAQYQSYREQGLSEMEATLMALESMNFSRRGLSPTMHMLSTLIPFFNAQIQGLDVLYRSLRGDMPFNEQLEVRKKLLTRGAMLFGMSMVYAAMMQDDEAYKNAKVEEKYSNFFMPLPGTDQLLRIPIPFELGYIFKALPEALVNTMVNEEGGEEALKALTFIAKQTVPGLASYFLPQAIKPALEVALDQSIYTGRDIESAQEKLVESGYRFRDNTTELAREVGEQTGVSPIKLEYLIRGYTGGMGMALVQAVSAPFGRTGPEAATKRPSDVPVVGTLFQPADASGIIDSVYERMNKARQVQETYESLVKKGRQDAAQAYLDRNLDSFALASLAGSFKQQMGEITKYEQTVRASNLTADQKREALDRARQAKINLAKAVRAASDRTERQAAPA